MMEIINALLLLVTAVIASVGVGIALFQLRANIRDAKASRIAQLSWQIYDTYESPKIRGARVAIEIVSHYKPTPKTADEYGQMYADNGTRTHNPDLIKHIQSSSIDSAVRRMLRFYQQIGILIEKGLVDPDFVFPLIGYGLETSEYGIRLAAQWYQNHQFYDGLHETSTPRDTYSYALKLCELHQSWKKSSNRSNKIDS